MPTTAAKHSSPLATSILVVMGGSVIHTACNIQELAHPLWDAVVVGAGTAGSAAAIQLAAAGQRVLLVDSKIFPRSKVCGGCLNERAWRILKTLAHKSGTLPVAERIASAGCISVNRMQLNCLGRSVQWRTPEMHAISRFALDSLLIEAAQELGVTFCGGAIAKVINDDATAFRSLTLTHANRSSRTASSSDNAAPITVRCKVAIIADGLGHSSLSDLPQLASQVQHGSRLGVGVTIADEEPHYVAGQLTMAVGKHGYVGLTRVEQNHLNIAAAVDAQALKGQGTYDSVKSILEQCHLPIPAGLREAQWSGTLPLTRLSRRVTARRLFTIGDSASYVEPFTGEGMSWALRDALNLCQLLTSADLSQVDSLAEEWNKQWQKELRDKQLVCRGLAYLLRRPKLAKLSLVLAHKLPWIAPWLIARASGVSETPMRMGAIG